MVDSINRALIRIWYNNAPCGVGFVVARGIFLTCAHVVNRALGIVPIEKKDRPSPAHGIEFDFIASPSLGLDGTKRHRATLKEWRPFDHDIAVLSFAPEIAPEITPPSLWSGTDPTGQKFSAFGFPAEFQNGRQESGTIQGAITEGWLEIRPNAGDTHDYFVIQGFSGTPAMADDGTVIGMVCATGPEPEKRLAYLIPIPHLEQAWPPLAQPYPGLSAFDERTARWFRGRDDFIELIVERLNAHHLVTIIGASGRGKSSVVMAGLVPRLRQEGWRIASFRPGEEPVRNFAKALCNHLFPNEGPGVLGNETDRLENLLTDEKNIHKGLDRIITLIDHGKPLLLIVDQFEELLTRANDDKRTCFSNILDHCIAKLIPQTKGKLHIAITLRSDYVEAMEFLPSARTLLNEAQVRLTPMNQRELVDAVQGPAEKLGVKFKDEIHGYLIGQVRRTPALLPLLQYALHEMWQGQQDRILAPPNLPTDRDTQDAILETLLAQRADEILDTLDTHGKNAAERLFTQYLVTTNISINQDTKRTATRHEIGDELWIIAEKFAGEGAWLLTIDQSTASDAAATVDIAHEALIRHWPTLCRWLDAGRAVRLWEKQIRDQIARALSPHDDLWLPHQVDEAQRMLDNASHTISPDVRHYAAQVLAYTRADRIWQDLGHIGRSEKAIKDLPTIPAPELRTCMLNILIHSRRYDTIFLRNPTRIAIGLVGINPAHRTRLAPWISEPTVGDEPETGLVIRCCLGLIFGIDLPIEILSAARECKNTIFAFGLYKLYAQICQTHVMRVTHLSDADESARTLLGILNETTDDNQYSVIEQTLAALAPRPDEHAQTLLYRLKNTTDPDQCAAIGQALAALAQHLSNPDESAQTLLYILNETRDPNQCAAISQALAALAQYLSNPDEHAQTLLDILNETRDLDQCAVISQTLAVIAALLPHPKEIARRILEKLHHMILDHYDLYRGRNLIFSRYPEKSRDLLAQLLAATQYLDSTDPSVIEIYGCLRLPDLQISNENYSLNHKEFQPSSFAEAFMAAFNAPSVLDAAITLKAAVPGVDLTRPWPDPLLPARS